MRETQILLVHAGNLLATGATPYISWEYWNQPLLFAQCDRAQMNAGNDTRAPFQYMIKRLLVRSREVSKPWDL